MVGGQKCNLTPGVVFLLLQEVMAPSDVKDASAPVMTLAGWSWDPREPGSQGCLGTMRDAPLQASEMDRQGVSRAIVM